MNRRFLATSLLIAIVLSLLVVATWAEQPPRKPSKGEEAAACAACGTLAGGAILIPILIIALNLALLIWVARDAKARGMDSSVLWMVLVMFTSVIGLIIYLFARPQGNMIRCSHCKNQRLQASALCPHCGHA